MKTLDAIIKLLQIATLISIIITCSIANWWMENDNIYQSFYYNSELIEIEGRVALHEAAVRKQEREDASNTSK